jgi:solute:Na+ symporter, SSS family
LKRLRALVFFLALPAMAGDYPRTLYAYPGRTPVVDGVLSPGEWDDALEFKGVSNWIHQSEPPVGLSVRMFVKHDAAHLYFAFDVTGDRLDNDAVAIFLNPSNQWNDRQTPAGDGASWSLICNLSGGLAGANNGAEYQRWIRSGAQQAVARTKPGRHGYVIEWAVSFNPCLEVAPGKFYSANMGDRAMGLNIAIYEGHAIEWLAGNKDAPTELRNWGTLWMKSRPINEAQPMKILRD